MSAREFSKLTRQGMLSDRSFLVFTLLLSTGVYLLGLVGSLPDPFASPIWPATGFQIAMYFRFGPRAIWAMTPGILIIQFQLGHQGGMEWMPALVFALVSWSAMTTEAVIAHRLTLPDKEGLTKQKAYLRFAILGAPLGTLSSAAQGVSVLLLFDAYGADIQWQVPYLVWWTGNLVGAYVLVPLLMLGQRELRVLQGHWLGLVAYVVATVAMVMAVSFSPNEHLQQFLILLLVLFLYLLIRAQIYALMVLCLSLGTLFFIVLQVSNLTVINVGNDVYQLFVLEGTLVVLLSMTMVMYHLVKAKVDLAGRVQRSNDELQTRVEERTQDLATEIKRKEGAELKLRRSHEVLACIDALRDAFIKEANPYEMYRQFLDQLLRLTNSKYGFVGDVLFDADGTPCIKMYAISDLAWNDETRELYAKLEDGEFIFPSLDNLIGDIVRTRQAVVSNNQEHDGTGSRVPKRHPRIDNFLGMPLSFGEQLVGAVGLANREGGFDEEITEAIRPVVDALAQITIARWERQAKDEAEQEVHRLAVTDSLTGIANRRQYDIHLARYIAECKRHREPLSLLMMDLDLFKDINDRYGHETGDQVLVEFAHLSSSLTRDTDLLARWGGEEFAVLLPRTDGTKARALAERMRSAVESHVFKGGHRITVSIGVATLDIEGDAGWLVSQADDALYKAKKGGRNLVVAATDTG